MVKAIKISNIFNACQRIGRFIQNMETLETIKYKNCVIEIYADEDCDYLIDLLKEDNSLFLVHYHSDFYVEKDDIITKDDARAIYQGGKIQQQKEINHHKKHIKEDKEAMIGIGTLIIFIAMVLVAAVAASVLIQTSQTLQQRAYKVGSETIQEVSSGIRIDDIIGYATPARDRLNLMAMIIAPRAGSQYIDLENVVVTVQIDNYTVLEFDSNLVAANVSANGVFHTLNDKLLNSTVFGMIVIHDSDNSILTTNGMNVGDSAFVIVNLSAATHTSGVLPRKEITGTILPEIGMSAVYYVRTPSVFENRIVTLY